jgi:Secretion system C-terminal sorting domain
MLKKSLLKLSGLLLLLVTHTSLHSQNWNWVIAKSYFADPIAYDHIVASDDSGNAYFGGAADVSPISLIKFDNTGAIVWQYGAKWTGGGGLARYVAARSGNEYLVGDMYNDTIIFNTDTIISRSGTSMFIAKFNSGGGYLWNRVARVPNNIADAVVDKSTTIDLYGNAFVTGYFKGKVVFDTNDSINTSYQSTFLVKYSPSGHVLWVKTGLCSVSNSYTSPYSVITDNSGNSYITGTYTGDLIFSTDTLKSRLMYNSFVVKYDPSGNILWTWAATITGATYNGGRSIATDNIGNAYLAGWFEGSSLKIGSTVLGPETKSTPYLAKFNSGGSVSWAKQGYPNDNDNWGGLFVGMDTLDNGYLGIETSSGNHSYSINLGTDSITFTESSAPYANAIVKFDTAGNFGCYSNYGQGNEDDGNGFCVSRSGKYVYVLGDVFGTITFGADTPITGRDIFYLGSWNPCPSTQEAVQNLSEEQDVKFYPNPGGGDFYLQVSDDFFSTDNGQEANALIEVYNILGEKIYSSNLNSQNYITHLRLADKPDGVYFYKIATPGNNNVSGKFIICH